MTVTRRSTPSPITCPRGRTTTRTYWDAADLYERANGRLYVSADFALPRDLSAEDQIALAREFAQQLTKDGSLPADLRVQTDAAFREEWRSLVIQRGGLPAESSEPSPTQGCRGGLADGHRRIRPVRCDDADSPAPAFDDELMILVAVAEHLGQTLHTRPSPTNPRAALCSAVVTLSAV